MRVCRHIPPKDNAANTFEQKKQIQRDKGKK